MLLNYTSRVLAQPRHPNNSFIFDDDQFDNYYQRPTVTRPVGVRSREALNKLNIDVPDLIPIGEYETAPWVLNPPICHLECTSYKKEETSNLVYQSTFREILNKYPNYIKIYTDGSKTDQGVGSAIAITNEQYHWSLSHANSVFSAELYAIWQALRYCDMSHHNSFLICSDSLSSIEVLKDSFSEDPLVKRIQFLLHWLNNINKTVIFVWTPGHAGIKGNEIADAGAREAAVNGIPENIPNRLQDMKVLFDHKIKENWQQDWNNTNAKLKIVKPTVDKWKMPLKLQRREQVALCRLRLGHTHLTSFHLLLGARPKTCESCGVQLTVKHILETCVQFSIVRTSLNMSNSLESILANNNDSIDKIRKFLHQANLLRKI